MKRMIAAVIVLLLAQSAKSQNGLVTEGSLIRLDSSGNPAGFCPLKRTDVKAEVTGFLARVTVTQEFGNPSQEKIEAVYTFPLPENAAVDDMTIQVGNRTVRGVIKKREEARAIYEHAKQTGHVAALLDQERPNIFTQAVANIMPGEQVVVTIKEVRVVPAGKEQAVDSDPGLPVIATYDTPRTVDILTLKFQQELLGTATIPAGRYQPRRKPRAPIRNGVRRWPGI